MCTAVHVILKFWCDQQLGNKIQHCFHWGNCFRCPPRRRMWKMSAVCRWKEKRGMSHGPGSLMPFFLGTHFSIKFCERLLLRSFSPSCAYYALCIFDAHSPIPSPLFGTCARLYDFPKDTERMSINARVQLIKRLRGKAKISSSLGWFYKAIHFNMF